MSKGQSLQEPYLNVLRKERVPVSIYLVNGIKLQGQIESFDQFVVLLRNTVSQMIYKHAISTIVPSRFRQIQRAPNPRAPDSPAGAGYPQLIDRSARGERALLVQPLLGGADTDDDLREFQELARSSDVDVVGVVSAPLRQPNPPLLCRQRQSPGNRGSRGRKSRGPGAGESGAGPDSGAQLGKAVSSAGA